MKRANGFTIVELLIVLALLGVASAIAATGFSSTISSYRWAWSERNYNNSQKTKDAHLEYAYQYNNGRLLNPVSYSGYNSSPVHLTSTNTAWVRFRDLLTAEGIVPSAAAHDGSAAEKLRVYQKFQRNENIPISGFSGETVRITYDLGVIYQTDCAKGESCASGRPGASPAYTASNYTTWDVVEPDQKPVAFSTYSMQRSLWTQTYGRITTVMQKAQDYYNSRLAAAPADQYGNNFLPVPDSSDRSGQAAASNQGCYNGWYDLGAGTVNVLEKLGLNKSSYSKTAWGGRIEYCADYDPSLSGEDTGPHSGALRIHFNVTAGANPVSNIANNRFFTF